MLDHGADDGILDFPVVQVHADFVADLELALWFLGGHATECMTGEGCFQRVGIESIRRLPRMLKLMVAVLVMISFGAAAIPQATAPDETDGMINGRSWLKSPELYKLAWLQGYVDGVRLATTVAHGEPCVTQVNKV